MCKPIWQLHVSIICACLALSASPVSADINIEVTPSFAPNGLISPSWLGYVGNAIASLERNLGDVGDREISPTAYEIAPPIATAREVTATRFPSWRGLAADTPLWDGPDGQFANERGNRIHFGLHAVGSGGMKFSLSEFEFEVDSNDPQDTFDEFGTLGALDYDFGRVGIDYVDGIKDNGNDIRYDQDNPAPGTTLVDELVYVGLGTAFQPELPLHQGSDDQETIDLLLADICLCDLNLLGKYAIRRDGSVIAEGTGRVRITTDPACGDFDEDGDVDSNDRTIQVSNWTGAAVPGTFSKTFNEGDCDGDGDVDTSDQTSTILNWTGAQTAGNTTDGGDADLIYDPATGNVTLDASDTSSGLFISFVLGADDGMRPENLTESAPGNAGPFFDVGTNTDAKTFQIGQTDPLNQGAGPEINLGDIFPAGLDLAGLADYLTLANYASELGAGGELDLIVKIPEPSSIALLLLGVLGLVARRRK